MKQKALFYIHGLYDAGYSQEQISQLTGVSRGSIVRYLVHGFEPSRAVDMMIVGIIHPIYKDLLKKVKDDGQAQGYRRKLQRLHHTKLKKKRQGKHRNPERKTRSDKKK